ncbi:MAG: 50S ribosomal protein L11 methyltransferase [Clostridiales bacterium]|nr:50S ribosomal protein L11 methyltransferase [Clostridiales bacterium]
MDWIEASVSTTTQAADAVSEALIRAGAKGSQIIDRADIPQAEAGPGYGELYSQALRDSLPADVQVKAWFASPEHLLLARSAISQLAGILGTAAGRLELRSRQVRDEDWAENWKRYFKPLRVGRRLVVRPVWETYDRQPHDLVIDMDPGMAFGTGTHETTRLCMEMIEAHFAGGSALDIGTGSGILAIALARLGADQVLAVDLDPVAVKAARENIARNGLAQRIQVRQGDLTGGISGQQFNLVCANILADVILSLAPDVRPLLAAGGRFLASGIIRERARDVEDALTGLGFSLLDQRQEGEWVALLFGVADA